MELIIQIIIAAAICFFIFSVILLAKDFSIMPVRPGKDARLTMVLSVKGAGGNLEQTVNALSWLRDSGKIAADIVIDDRGLDREGKKLAEILATGRKSIFLTRDGNIGIGLEEGNGRTETADQS